MDDEVVKKIEEIGRAIIQNQDAMLLWMQQDAKRQIRQAGQLNSSYIMQAGKMQSLLDWFGALALPASPQITREVTVGAVIPQLLYKNDTHPFKRIVVTDDDPAQWIYVGNQNVNINIGEIIPAQGSGVYVIAQGQSLWAICMVATVSVRVSESVDLLGRTQTMRPAEPG